MRWRSPIALMSSSLSLQNWRNAFLIFPVRRARMRESIMVELPRLWHICVWLSVPSMRRSIPSMIPLQPATVPLWEQTRAARPLPARSRERLFRKWAKRLTSLWMVKLAMRGKQQPIVLIRLPAWVTACSLAMQTTSS